MAQNKRPTTASSKLHRAQMAARYREAAANDWGPRYRIMIVQDDFLLRMETAADLRQWGYDVVEAFSEAEARRALQVDRRIASGPARRERRWQSARHRAGALDQGPSPGDEAVAHGGRRADGRRHPRSR